MNNNNQQHHRYLLNKLINKEQYHFILVQVKQ
jgi:hypothetical protein